MPKLLKELLPELPDYFSGNKKHPGYGASVKQWKRLKLHADGETPTEMLEKVRPNESPEELAYRTSIWSSVSKGTISRVLTCIGKIRKSRDFVISYPVDKVPSGLAPEEQPKEYFENHIPGDESFENWIFDTLMRSLLIDTGAVVMVMPSNLEVNDAAQYRDPFGHIFHSDRVLAYVDNDYCLVHSEEKHTYTDQNGNKYHDGDIFYLATTMEIIRFVQTSANKTVAADQIYQHNRGRLPAKKMPGVYKKKIGAYKLTESRIDSIADRLNEQVREWSDFQISKVLTMHPESAEFRNIECSGCNGTGNIMNPSVSDDPEAPAYIVCTKCHGDRYSPVGPFKRLVQTPTKASDLQAPWPPKVFIVRDVEVLKLMNDQIELHTYVALSSINMEHLAKTPSAVAESGIKKLQDVDELNVLVYSIGSDLMSMANWTARWIIDIRWEERVREEAKRLAMVPVIPVPDRLDILSTENYLERLKQAKDSGVSPYILNEMQKEVAAKQFSSEPEKRQFMDLMSALDPLPVYSIEDKILLKGISGVSQKSIVISANLYPWLLRLTKDKSIVGKLSGMELEDALRAELDKLATLEIEAAKQAQKSILDDVIKKEEEVEE